uniref:Uncharacterized protein n=1 Tax=Arundo donax TaxID=35708 RepID=A0A0A9FDM3_ARUDO
MFDMFPIIVSGKQSFIAFALYETDAIFCYGMNFTRLN